MCCCLLLQIYPCWLWLCLCSRDTYHRHLNRLAGLTLSRSQTSFQNSVSALYSYRAPVQPALGPLCARCMTCMNRCFGLFAGSEQSMCNDADIIYGSQTELAGRDEWQIGIMMECECHWRTFNYLCFFLYYAYPIILNDRLCRIYLFFLFCTFHCVNSKMLN